MNLPGTICINEQGHLQVGDCDVVELARTFGTPLYIYDEMGIRQKCREYHRALAANYQDYKVLYASKAFSSLAICRLMEQEGLGLDVVSGGELYTALAADFPPEKIYFHGNNKSIEELNLALSAGVGYIVVDNPWELENLAQLAAGRKTRVKILLRLTPGIETHTHHYIQTGQLDSKFGISLSGGAAMEVVKRALALPEIELVGIHCHIGSQVFNSASFRFAAERMIDFMAAVKEETGHQLTVLNLGGGLGISYTENDQPDPIDTYIEGIAATVKEACANYNLPLPTLVVEPGRSLVGEAGIAVYRVGTVKEIHGVRTYASVDGGMADNPRPALYQARYQALVANKANAPREQTYTIAGKCCESGDILIQDIELPRLVPGDLIAVLSSGAYQYAMASNYNRLPRPAVITVAQGRAEIIVRRETYSDLIRCDRIPPAWTEKDTLPAVM
ncbi:MAG: diaminopimelate decarboxylase [bacterium]|jgi:diaminopimelate decarboxylase|nr:diaminopimelate decarboxylase [Bacillota bacterium]HHW54260.1 diaminopimelate decarboxylase [Bacillota bacterium]